MPNTINIKATATFDIIPSVTCKVHFVKMFKSHVTPKHQHTEAILQCNQCSL